MPFYYFLMETDAIYPMRAAVRRSGLSAHVIRAWERRYAAVAPQRSPGGRRLYSASDIERLKLLSRGVKAGNSISRIAGMDTDALMALLTDDIPPSAAVETPPDDLEVSSQTFVNEALVAVKNLDPAAMERALERAAVALPRMAVIGKVVLPLVEIIGQLWAQGRIKIVNEHVGSAVIRQFLWEAMRTAGDQAQGPVIVTAAPKGQWHEFGAMMAAVIAMDNGWRGLYCGPNLPAEEIAAAVKLKRARVVALSVVQPAQVHPLARELQRLMRLLPKSCDLIIGGRFSDTIKDHFSTPGPVWIPDYPSFQLILQKYQGG